MGQKQVNWEQKTNDLTIFHNKTSLQKMNWVILIIYKNSTYLDTVTH